MFGIFRVISLRRKAMSGDIKAQFELGYMYDTGKGAKQDYTKAVEWYQKAAEHGNEYAQNNLGLMYKNGNGVKQDYTKAVEWYQKASEQGNEYAQNNLGVMYENGYGVKQDYTKAVEWYQKASEQGNEYAQNNLGVMYKDGKGVKQNSIEGGKYFFLAAKAGLLNAKNNLNAMFADIHFDFSINNNITSKNHKKPDATFMEALIKASDEGDIEKVKSLLSSGKDVNFRYQRSLDILEGSCTYFVDTSADTPLEKAVNHGNTKIVKLLLEAGADVNIGDNGYTPLGNATYKGNAEIVRLLIESGADVNTCLINGETPLYDISSHNYIDDQIKIVKLLLIAGALPDSIERSTGYTPLILASCQGNLEIVQLLLEAGASINITDKKGKTPLDWAVQFGYAEVVKLLTETESSKLMQEKVEKKEALSSCENQNSMDKGLSPIRSPLEIEDVRSSPSEENLQNDVVLPTLDEVFSLLSSDSRMVYIQDKNEANTWFNNQGFPYVADHRTKLGADYFYEMSLSAERDAIWKESWAGFHFALDGYLNLNKTNKIADILFRLGRSKTALAHYDIANIYYNAGIILSKKNNENDLYERIVVERLVLANLTHHQDKIDDAIKLVNEVIFPNGIPISSAKSLALTLFKEGDKQQQWVKNGKPVQSCLVFASGYYEGCIEINSILNDKMGIAVASTNLGTLWNKLNEKNKARTSWEKALNNFIEIGSEQNIVRVKQWLSEL